MNQKIVSNEEYRKPLTGISDASGEMVTIIGEQTVQLDDGSIVEQYLYHIDSYVAQNGKPFAALKANITLLESP